MFEQSGRLFVPSCLREELIEKRGFVARATRRVEDRVVRRAARELVGDELERVVPRDRLVVLGTFAQNHRLRQATLRVEPLVAFLRELAHRMTREEFSIDAELRRFVGDVLHAVLAKLEDVAMLGLRPRATRTIESAFLIQLEQRSRAAHEPHRPRHLEARDRRADPRGLLRRLLRVQIAHDAILALSRARMRVRIGSVVLAFAWRETLPIFFDEHLHVARLRFESDAIGVAEISDDALGDFDDEARAVEARGDARHLRAHDGVGQTRRRERDGLFDDASFAERGHLALDESQPKRAPANPKFHDDTTLLASV